MADLTDDEITSIERSLGGPSRVAVSNSETCRMLHELKRHRADRDELGSLRAMREALERAAAEDTQGGDPTEHARRVIDENNNGPVAYALAKQVIRDHQHTLLLMARATQTASAERAYTTVLSILLDARARAEAVDERYPYDETFALRIADRVAAQLTTFEDGGEPRSRQTFGPRATQERGGHARPGATAQGAVPAAGNVAEPQLDPTPDRVEHPPSSSFDPTNHEHVTSLAKALGFTHVTIRAGSPVEGMPGYFENSWRARLAGVEYGGSGPHAMNASTVFALEQMSRHFYDTVMSLVAGGIVGKR